MCALCSFDCQCAFTGSHPLQRQRRSLSHSFVLFLLSSFRFFWFNRSLRFSNKPFSFFKLRSPQIQISNRICHLAPTLAMLRKLPKQKPLNGVFFCIENCLPIKSINGKCAELMSFMKKNSKKSKKSKNSRNPKNPRNPRNSKNQRNLKNSKNLESSENCENCRSSKRSRSTRNDLLRHDSKPLESGFLKWDELPP